MTRSAPCPYCDGERCQIGRGGAADCEFVKSTLDELAEGPESIYIAGTPKLLKAIADEAKKRGLDETRIRLLR